MIEIKLYQNKFKFIWNKFVNQAKNGIFFFQRDYMDYHSDRFIDNSLLIYKNNKLLALLPSNIENDKLISYGGLTFGGVISDYNMKIKLMLEIFENVIDYMLKNNYKKLIYKSIPNIYHIYPSEEDLYALFRNNAKLIRRDVSSTINLSETIKYSKGRKWSIKKSKSKNFKIIISDDFKSFMEIEEKILTSKYGVNPVHTHEEISLLHSIFPNNIKLFAIYNESIMLGGVIIYESQNVAHAQYISATEKGKEYGVLDCILNYLITHYYSKKKYFDFGISTEKKGTYLNELLIQNKESYGARSIVHDFYELTI